MAKKHKQTPSERAYYKQIKRINNFMRRAEKRGYIFNENVLPKKPKHVTQASVRRLVKITPEKLYKKAKYGGILTDGEIISATEAIKLERSLRAIKSVETRKLNKKAEEEFFSPPPKKVMSDSGYMMFTNVFDDFIARLSTPTPELTYFGNKRQLINYETSERSRITLYNLTIREVNKVGKGELGYRLEQHADEVQDLIVVVLYGSDAAKIASATARLASIITDSLTTQELLDLSEEEEYNEDWELPE